LLLKASYSVRVLRRPDNDVAQENSDVASGTHADSPGCSIGSGGSFLGGGGDRLSARRRVSQTVGRNEAGALQWRRPRQPRKRLRHSTQVPTHPVLRFLGTVASLLGNSADRPRSRHAG